MSVKPGLEELLVLCSESELQEYGEIIRVGEQVTREAGRREGRFYGGDLDEIQWQFDQYARVVGYEAAIITGRVTVIHAVYVNLTRQPDGWGPLPGSAHLEQIQSTADARTIEEGLPQLRLTPSG